MDALIQLGSQLKDPILLLTVYDMSKSYQKSEIAITHCTHSNEALVIEKVCITFIPNIALIN